MVLPPGAGDSLGADLFLQPGGVSFQRLPSRAGSCLRRVPQRATTRFAPCVSCRLGFPKRPRERLARQHVVSEPPTLPRTILRKASGDAGCGP
ncbi:hypothetical protein V1477_013675, partial [Vespula maculifrons]